MRCLTLTVAALVLASGPAHGHFVYLVPHGETKIHVIFSDSLNPDDNVPIEKIANTKLYARDASGKESPLGWTQAEKAYVIPMPSGGAQVIGGTCTYGVFQRGDSKPMMLYYHPKLILGELAAAKAWERLPVEIVPSGPGHFLVLQNGKPVREAEVSAILPGDKGLKLKTNVKGEFTLETKTPGLYGIWARANEQKSGEHEGKKYEEVRHYATLVFNVSAKKAGVDAKDEHADPAATKLLADARAARSVWNHFPGFTATVDVNFDGHVSRGKLIVDNTGRVTLQGVAADQEPWARRTLGSAVSHRLPGAASLETPCRFAEKDEQHPLGRVVVVLNDELHSSYRIKDRQIMVVNRVMSDGRFSILMQENITDAGGKFLPAAYVVNHWNQAGELARSEAHTNTWTRVGTFDLPVLIRVVTCGKEVNARSIVLSDHRLSTSTAEAK